MQPLPDAGSCFATLILAVFNEEKHIEECLDSLANQDYPTDRFEVLVIDGGSGDRTRGIAEAYAARHGFIRVMDNPRRLAPVGWNIGINNARGDIIILLSGHAYMAEDFISRNVELHREHHIACCGGPVTSIGEDGLSTTISLACNSSFGVGNAHYRYLQKQAYVETVAFGAYRREIFDQVGLFDEALARNADWELNYRISRAGGKMLLSPEIKSSLYIRSNLAKLWTQQYLTGFWKTSVIKKHPRSLLPRHLAPPLFVLGLAGSLVAGVFFPPALWLLAAIVGSYLLAALVVTARIGAREKNSNPLLLPIIFLILHLSYGTGFIAGLIAPAFRRKAKSPNGNRRA